MSFILDALRKSEHERRMETAPDIMHAPTAVARSSLPMWSILLMGGLAAALIAVSLFSFFQRSGFSESSTAELPASAPDTPAAAPAADNSDAVPRVAAEAPALPAPGVSTAPAPASVAAQPQPAATLSQLVANPPPAATAPAPVPTAQTDAAPAIDVAPRIDPARLPQYADVLAEGLPVGALQMQLHVHSAAAASRFVVINGARRVAGDRLSEGAVVEEIVPEGAVLSYNGRRFLLTPN